MYSTRILSQRVFIHAESLYSRATTLNTQRQLANLGIFKFVNINYDTSGAKFVANIFTSPLNRYSWSNEAGLTVTQGFPGPYYNMSFLKRNLFGGLEIFELNGRFGFEGVSAATEKENIYKSVTGNLNASVTFPQFLFPMSAAAIIRLGKYNPKTKVLAGYTYTDRPEYNRRTTTFSHTYTWENGRTSQYSFTLANLNIIRSTINPSTNFDSVLNALRDQGNNLINTFNPSFVSSLIFSWTWNPNEYGNTTDNSMFLRTSVESGGTTLNFIKLGNNENFEGLQLYKYLRFNVDFRRNRILNNNSVLAYRVNTGLAWSYIDGDFLPYEKYFFAGGSNSVRAWRPRRLGLGSYPPILSSDERADGLFDYSFEKPGEILLEGSIELRQKLFGFVSGAVFLDWGNVWSFREIRRDSAVLEASNQPQWTGQGSSKFNFDTFYKEIGIGTGFGLRFDFSFLVLRLDAGIKVYDPARQKNDRFVLDNVKFFKPFGFGREPVIFNVGIGYPF
jgi:outer membrane protein assembly factor BamA